MINVTHKISTLVKCVTTPVIVFTRFHLPPGQKCRCWSVINFLEFNKYIKNISHTSECMFKVTSVSQDIMSYVRGKKRGNYITEYH